MTRKISFLTLALLVIVALTLSLTGHRVGLAGGPISRCKSGQPFLWPNGGADIPYNPDQGGLGPLTNAEAVAEVQTAFNVWGGVSTATVNHVNAGPLPVDVDATNFLDWLITFEPDGYSPIIFDETGEIFDLLFGPGSGILGFAGVEMFDLFSCTILEGRAVLNGGVLTDITVLRDVLVHEFGHYTGLAHSVVNGQMYLFEPRFETSGPAPYDTFGPPPDITADVVETMYPFYFGPAQGQRTLHKDDVAMLSALYPGPSFPAGSWSISGQVLAPNGTVALNGVNVIARNVADPFYDAVSAISGDFTAFFAPEDDPYTGAFTLDGLTPGAEYAVFVDQIFAGSFSTPPIVLPGPEEFYNGAQESADGETDNPAQFTPLTAGPGETVNGVNVIFNYPPQGQPLPMGINHYREFYPPFPFTLCGQEFDTVFVNENGNLTFGAGDRDRTESAGNFIFGPPRIAPLWDDLDTFFQFPGGYITYFMDSNAITFRWQDVPEFNEGGSNTFEVTLHATSNHIDFHYEELSVMDGLAGVGCGDAVTVGAEFQSDLSELESEDRINLHNQPALYEPFSSSNPNDLANRTLLFNGTTDYEDQWAEPNETRGQARPVRLPFNSAPLTNYTEIEPAGDVDFYAFNADGGTSLIVEIQSSRVDTIIGLFDANGNLLALDDDGGLGVLSRLVYPVSETGKYYLGVTTWPDFDFVGFGFGDGRYLLDIFTVRGGALPLGDDNSVLLPLPFTFPFQGATYDNVYVQSNGNLTFGSPQASSGETVAGFLAGPPRIAGLWDDLSPNWGGGVFATGDASSFTVTWQDVPQFLQGDANTFSITLHADGTVVITYEGIGAEDGLVGLTPGGGAADPGATDLSTASSLSANGTTYQLFTPADPFDLDRSVLTFKP